VYYGFACVENNPVKANDDKYSRAMCHAGLVNNSLVTDYDIGVYSRCSNQIFIGQKCLTKKSKATPKSGALYLVTP
jgi:hypothetical protein